MCWAVIGYMYCVIYILGVGVLEGDGDVYRTDNQRVFRQFVWENTGGAGLHFVMADGVSLASLHFVMADGVSLAGLHFVVG